MAAPARPSGRQVTPLEDEAIHAAVATSASTEEEPDSAAPPSSARPRTSTGPSPPGQSIQVLCRFRPESAREVAESQSSERDVNGEPLVEFDGVGGVTINLRDERQQLKRSSYAFDRVFSPEAQQEDIYDAVGRSTVQAVLDGFNAAILSYGQTGSGKTYTMLGPGFDGRAAGSASAASAAAGEFGGMHLGDPGLTPRVMQSLFAQIAAMESDTLRFTLRASYIEIYMENVRDLLNPLSADPSATSGGPFSHRPSRASLEIRQDSQRGMLLPDATEVPLHSLTDVYATLRRGARHRVSAATRANESSSRSHAILLVTCQRRNVTSGVTKVSQLYLADLAGSEKVEKTEVTGLNLQEANLINKGLLSLGQVIQALVAQGEKEKRGGAAAAATVHIPYRSSRLTRLLSNCIGGNSRTSLLVTCSPSPYNIRETLSTLRFAQAMKRIENRAVQNVEVGVAELKRMYKACMAENEALKRQVGSLQSELKLMGEVDKFEKIRAGADGHQGERSNNPEEKHDLDEDDPEEEAYLQAVAASVAESRRARPPPPKLAFMPHSASSLSISSSSLSPTTASPCSASASSGAPSSASCASSATPASAGTLSSVWRERAASASLSRPEEAHSEEQESLHSSPVAPRMHLRPRPRYVGGGVYEPSTAEEFGSDSEDRDTIDMPALRAALREEVASRSAEAPRLVPARPRDRNSPSDLRQLLLHFLCPLSKRVMRDPVLAMDGVAYERRDIQAYFLRQSGSGTTVSPVTGQVLASRVLIPNTGLLQQIRKFYPEALQNRHAGGLSARGMLSVSAAGSGGGLDAPYFSCLPLVLLSLVGEALDHRSLLRWGQCSRETHAVSSDARLWKLMVVRRGWPMDMQVVRELPGASVQLYFKTLWKQRVPLSTEAARRREEEKAHWKGVYLAAPPTRRADDANLDLQ